MTTPPLVKQPRDECRLEQDYSTNGQDLCTILIPYSQFAKINLASGHQAAFANPPPPHFPPVKFWCCKPGGWYLDVASPLAAKDANGHGGCQAAPLATECIGPPTIARPKKASLSEKMGALA